MDAVKTGRLISELRREKQLTQLELAQLLGVTDKAVSRWETGRGMPDLGILESLSAVLDVSIAELIRGERVAEVIGKEDVRELSAESFSAAKQVIRRRRNITVTVCVIISLILIAEIFVFLNSPIYMQWTDGLLIPEILPDGRITAKLPEDASGYETVTLKEDSSGLDDTFVFCYRTLWDIISHKHSSALVLLGDTASTGIINYCPGPDLDVRIYTKPGLDASYGSRMLPLYPLGASILSGLVVSAAYLVFCLGLRKGGVMIPLWVGIYWLPRALAVVMMSWLFHGKLYNKPFYILGVSLLSVLIVLIFFLFIYLVEKRKRHIRNSGGPSA